MSKVFVGKIPEVTPEVLSELFTPYGHVEDIYMHYNKGGVFKRAAFVRFTSESEAQDAIDALNDTPYPGETVPMVLHIAGQHERKSEVAGKLFVGCLPPNFKEADVSEMFSPYGEIAKIDLLAPAGPARAGFVVFEHPSCAVDAKEALHESCELVPGRPLNVRMATSKQQRAGPPHNPREHSRAPAGAAFASQLASVGGVLPIAQRRRSAVQIAAELIDECGGDLLRVNAALAQAANRSENTRGHEHTRGHSQPPRPRGGTRPGHGPPGANIMVLRLPKAWNETQLLDLFTQCGEVVHHKLARASDGTSLGYGFVTFATPQAANTAVQECNGLQVGSDRLKVEINNKPKPY